MEYTHEQLETIVNDVVNKLLFRDRKKIKTLTCSNDILKYIKEELKFIVVELKKTSK